MVTDTDVRQIHYYDDEHLLLYVSDGDSEATRYASHLGEAFKADKKKALRDAWSVVKKVHAEAGVPEEDMVEPSYARCVHAYWEAGSHKWRVGADVRQCVASVADGSADGSQVYLVGDAFCDMQGWVEGAIDVAEQAFAKAFPETRRRWAVIPTTRLPSSYDPARGAAMALWSRPRSQRVAMGGPFLRKRQKKCSHMPGPGHGTGRFQ